MKNFLSPLKIKGYMTLLGLIIIGFGWLMIDQIFLPKDLKGLLPFLY
jgi:hypothetical protein